MDDKNKDFIDVLTYTAEMFAKTNESKQTEDKEKKQIILFHHPDDWLNTNFVEELLRWYYPEHEILRESSSYIKKGTLLLHVVKEFKLPHFTGGDEVMKRYEKDIQQRVYRAIGLDLSQPIKVKIKV